MYYVVNLPKKLQIKNLKWNLKDTSRFTFSRSIRNEKLCFFYGKLQLYDAFVEVGLYETMNINDALIYEYRAAIKYTINPKNIFLNINVYKIVL